MLDSLATENSYQKNEDKFPCLKISVTSGEIVFFIGKGTGTVVRASSSIDCNVPLGYCDCNFDYDKFIPFHGSVTLTSS